MNEFEIIDGEPQDWYPQAKAKAVEKQPKPKYYSDYDKPLSNLYKDYEPKPRSNQGVLREVCSS